MRVDTGAYSASLLPPDEQTKGEIGPGDFRAVGEQFLGHFRDLGGLRRTDRVLDIGCGSGRMAAPLTVFLDPSRGSYEGFDVTEAGVSWCRHAYQQHPNFRFRHAEIQSDLYELAHGVAAEEYRFPYEDREFDFVLLASIFTHLMPAVVEHYLDEISRVLKPGGTCFATYYLMDPRVLDLSRDTPAALKFHRMTLDGPAWTTDPGNPEAVVGYDLDHVLYLYAVRALAIAGLHRGRWPVVYPVLMPEARSYQDIVVARRS